jgi:hypothetical protein
MAHSSQKEEQPVKTIRLLTIGNSFADNALTYLEPLAASGGEARFVVGRANLGGCSLEKHWNLAAYTAAHPEYKTYPYFRPAGTEPAQASLQDALAAEAWDVVTLQQVSAKSWRAETFEPFLGKLIGLVRERAPQAAVRLHQTWAYRDDCPFFPDNGLTPQLMHERIRAAYRHYAAVYGCSLLPSGEAIQRARSAPGRAFVWPEAGYAYRQAPPPTLPRQEHSLAAGWYWAIRDTAEGVPELRLDATHLNSRGNYLIGCLWYEALSGCPVRDGMFVPDSIDTADAAFLRATAQAALAQAR